jgi:hypothetical protein
VRSGGIEIYFASLPAWFLAILVYVLASAVVQRRGGGEAAR